MDKNPFFDTETSFAPGAPFEGPALPVPAIGWEEAAMIYHLHRELGQDNVLFTELTPKQIRIMNRLEEKELAIRVRDGFFLTNRALAAYDTWAAEDNARTTVTEIPPTPEALRQQKLLAAEIINLALELKKQKAPADM
jgi:hypothetical protein